MWLANLGAGGSMWGRGVLSSESSSMSKNTAPGICAARYSAMATRLACGKYQEASAIRTSGASRCPASHSVETSGDASFSVQKEDRGVRQDARARAEREAHARAGNRD